MRINKSHILLLFCFFLACNEKPQNVEVDFLDIVKTLQTTETKVAYLSGVYNQDIELKEQIAKAIQQYGYNSDQHQAAQLAYNEAYKLNLIKIESYLQVFGYPDKQSLKTNSVDAVYNILHDSNELEVKSRNFKYMYGAYRNRDLPGGSLAFYLHKYYELKTGEKMNLQSPFTEEFELDTLTRALGLDLNQISY